MAYVERRLAALVYGGGASELERANISALLRVAVERGWISEQEFVGLDNARALRNSVTHFRRPFGEGTLELRSLNLSTPPYPLLEEDARHVMQAVFGLLARQAL
jgi:hypothetical protein